ncbi:MAG: ABC transporter permease [Acidobacteria bacterium]|nr:ABC transporter permease [Acidobacteriota bacterium]
MTILQNTRYFVREALHSLWLSRARNVLSLATIAISLAVTGVFLYISLNARAIAQAWARDIPLVFFLRGDATEADIGQLHEKLESSPLVEHAEYVGEKEALERFKRLYAKFAGLATDLGENPFPASFEVKLRSAGSRGAMQSFVDEIRQTRCVSDVQFDEEWVRRIDAALLLIDMGGIFLGGVFVLASIFTISNVIRLNIYSYQEEIEIMMLVGAKLGFIRAPFLIEGALQGMLGGLLSIGVLFGLLRGFVLYVAPMNPLITSLVKLQFLPVWACAALVGGGMLMGFAGSATSVGKVVSQA